MSEIQIIPLEDHLDSQHDQRLEAGEEAEGCVMNYDPNLFLCGQRARQEIHLTFAIWQYRAERTFVLYSNISGLDAIKCAVIEIFESLPGFGHLDIPRIVLTDENGDTMICDDEEDEGEDWLFKMLIKAEIVAVAEGGRLFDPAPEDATK